MKTDTNDGPAGSPAENGPEPEPSGCDQTGAYALILNGSGEILLVEDNGRHYLPGGRLERGETAEQALVREIREECGCAAIAGEPLGQAMQPIFGGRTLLLATYWRAEIGEPAHGPAEHRSRWRALAEAIRLLHRAADREILARFAG